MMPSTSLWLDDKNEEKKTVREQFRVGATGTALDILFHPLHNAAVLMKLGYEPWPLQRGRSWGVVGRHTYFLPNAFAYASYLEQQHGFLGLFTGFCPRIVGQMAFIGVRTYTQLYVDKKWSKLGGHLEFDEERQMSELDVDDRQSLRRAIRSVVRQSVVRTVASVAARPFQVIAIRQVAQLIGGETTYVGVIDSFSLIYKEEGIKGLFAGLGAKLVGDLTLLWAVSGVTYVAQRFFVRCIAEFYLFLRPKAYVLHGFLSVCAEQQEELDIEPEPGDGKTIMRLFRFLVDVMAQLILSSYTYPFDVVSTVMAVNGCSLKAGSLPFVARFDTWRDCYKNLAERGQLMRGAKLFLRIYEGPVMYKNNVLVAKI